MNASGNMAPRFRAAAIYGGAIRRGLGAPKRSGCGAIGDCQKHCTRRSQRRQVVIFEGTSSYLENLFVFPADKMGSIEKNGR